MFDAFLFQVMSSFFHSPSFMMNSMNPLPCTQQNNYGQSSDKQTKIATEVKRLKGKNRATAENNGAKIGERTSEKRRMRGFKEENAGECGLPCWYS